MTSYDVERFSATDDAGAEASAREVSSLSVTL